MPILTREDLEKRLSPADIAQLSDMDAQGSELPGMVEASLSDAEAEVLGYLRVLTRAALPDPAPEMLKRLVCDIARYNLYQRHLPEDHPVVVAYKLALKKLEQIAQGELVIDLSPSTEGGDGYTAGSAYAPPRVFTDSALSGATP